MRNLAWPAALAVATALAAGAAAGSVPAPRDSVARDPSASASAATRDTTASTRSAVAATPDSLATPGEPAALPFVLRPVAVLVAGSPDGDRMEPAGVATDAFGRVYLADATTHELRRYDATGRLLARAGALGSGDGALRRPGSVGLLGAVRVAVLDIENRRVSVYDAFDRWQGHLVRFETLESELGRIDPVALASDRGGAFYVADRDRDRILAFDFSGRFVRALGGFGEAPGSFRGLADLAATRHGELVTTERSGRVQRLDASGQPRAAWMLPGRAGAGALPVAADDSSRIAVGDERRGIVWVFAPDGRPLARAEDVAGPRALAFAPDGTLLVGESAAGRVRRFALEPRAPREE